MHGTRLVGHNRILRDSPAQTHTAELSILLFLPSPFTSIRPTSLHQPSGGFLGYKGGSWMRQGIRTGSQMIRAPTTPSLGVCGRVGALCGVREHARFPSIVLFPFRDWRRQMLCHTVGTLSQRKELRLRTGFMLSEYLYLNQKPTPHALHESPHPSLLPLSSSVHGLAISHIARASRRREKAFEVSRFYPRQSQTAIAVL